MLAAARIGAKVVELSNDITTVGDVRLALAAAKAKVIAFDVNKNSGQDKLLLLRKSIPEFYHCKHSAPCFMYPLLIILYGL